MLCHLDVTLLKGFQDLIIFLSLCPLLFLPFKVCFEELLYLSGLTRDVVLNELALRAEIELFLVDLLLLIEAVEL